MKLVLLDVKKSESLVEICRHKRGKDELTSTVRKNEALMAVLDS